MSQQYYNHVHNRRYLGLKPFTYDQWVKYCWDRREELKRLREKVRK